MKKIFFNSIFLSSLFSIGVVFFILSIMPFSFAESKSTTQQRSEIIHEGMPVPGCMDNFLDWDYSNTYQSSPWNLTFLGAEAEFLEDDGIENQWPRREHFIDINGDGFLDYLYAYHTGESGDINTFWKKYMQGCIYLGTGNGWNIAYKCYAHMRQDRDGTVHQTYYGDCADTSS